jgi:CRISPR-associated protein Cas1
MIKRTLYFGNPTYLNTHAEQLQWQLLADNSKDKPWLENAIDAINKPIAEEDDFLQGIAILQQHSNDIKKTNPHYQEQPSNQKGSAPIEDIAVVILDNAQIVISHALIAKLLANNVALITCDAAHHPTGMLLSLDGNTLQSHRWQAQQEASVPLKKQLWQQTIQAKIENQATLLKAQGVETGNMHRWMQDVKSGDSQNHEARAAVYYWKHVFTDIPNFERSREGLPPNNLLNYSYAILRAIVARSLVGSGLLPTLGIFHKNQYNAYCLADDIMEPYRPILDKLVLHVINKYGIVEQLSTYIKKELLAIPILDVQIDGQTSPLMIAVQRTTASLVKCFEGSQRKILYPILQ